jgi:crotonobetainyl-CoA:carnitine CoA-transferase CaiB-like acyl-CoA transferase
VTPLRGLRVLDLTGRVAGAYATKLLADAGADVIKLEPPAGDPLRRRSASGAPIAPDARGALFAYLCTSKRSALADLTRPEGLALARQLAATADVLIESFEPGEIESLGLGPDALAEHAPGCTLVSLSSFGRGGPWSRRTATEFTLQAWCGSTGGRGLPEEEPLAAGGMLGEWIAGLYAALGALVAARRARSTGQGDHVDVSLLECMSVALAYHEHLKASLSGDLERWVREEFSRQLEVPSIEPARDGWVGFALFTAQMWTSFCEMVERPELGKDPELCFMLRRWPRRAEVHAAIHPWLRAHTVDEIVAEASRRRIPVARIGDGASVLQMDHFRATGAFVRNPDGFLQPRVPWRMSHAEPRPLARAPRPGEHQADVERESTEQGPWRRGTRRDGSRSEPQASEGAGAAGESPRRDPLEGIRVADFTQFIAGPTVTHLLAALGADVVKVESIQRPDGIRFASSRTPDVPRWWEYSWIFHGFNANKRSVTLNLKQPAGAELARRLVRDADFVVENFAPDVLEGFGLGWDEVARLNPRAILLRMPAFGFEGPWRDRVGLAQTMEQLTGMAAVTGLRDGPPVIPRGPCDGIAGLHAAFAGLAALEARERDGRGRLVVCNMAESALNVAAEPIVEHAAHGRLLTRDGNRDPVDAPQNVYRCAGTEQWLALSIASDAQWERLVAWLGSPTWAADPELRSAAARRAATDRLDTELARVFSALERDAAVELLAARGIPAAAVIASPHVVHNPQHAARGFYQPLAHPVAGVQLYARLPMRFARGPERHVTRPPPLLGEHNDAVLRGELGLAAGQLEELRRERVSGETPVGF